MKDRIEDVAEWIGDSKLNINDDKTELMAIGTRSKLSQVIAKLAAMSISGIPFSQSVRNLSFYSDEKLFMDAHIKYTCAASCSVSCAELEKSAPSCQLMLPTKLLFLSFSLG